MRLHKTMLNECYRFAFRAKIDGGTAAPRHRGTAALQPDLGTWLDAHNAQRVHQGRWGDGKTPLQTFLDAPALAKDKRIPLPVARAAQSVRPPVRSSLS
ncbi:integrase [Pandoraea sputorum]|uniref:Integrase n=1 Tax=Pandoraea sputorum TaxID=93222 RepID=A0A5E5BIN1_9BURK|nr:integrase [Pandoraea sputorum]